MTDIASLKVSIQTARLEDADTDGAVYLGVCGREFRCDAEEDLFKRGSSKTFVFGDGSNVLRPEANDPRNPQLTLEEVDRFPVYIRFEQGASNHWLIQRAVLTFNSGFFPIYESRPGNLWLGKASGAYSYLINHALFDRDQGLVSLDQEKLKSEP